MEREVAEEVVAEIEAMSVGSEMDEDEVVHGKIVVRLPGDWKRRIVELEEDREVEKEEEELIALLGLRAICGGLFRRVGKESVLEGGGPRLVAGGSSTRATVGVSRERTPGTKVQGRVGIICCGRGLAIVGVGVTEEGVEKEEYDFCLALWFSDD